MNSWNRRMLVSRSVAALTTLMVVLAVSPAMAQQWPVEDYDEGVGDRGASMGHTATVELGWTPTPGNTLIAISAHRVSWDQAQMVNSGWNKALEMVFEPGDSNHRRGLAMWYRVVQEDEPEEVTITWRNDGDLTDGNRAHLVQVFEVEGQWMLDTSAAAASPDESVNSVVTGGTAVASETPSLVVVTQMTRGDGGEAEWDNGFETEEHFFDEEGSAGVTMNTGFMVSEDLQYWEAEASWGSATGSAIGAIAVFKPYEEVEWLFDCDNEESHTVGTEKGHVYLMLDRSGSMRALYSEMCWVNVCCYDGFSDSSVPNCGNQSTCSGAGNEPISSANVVASPPAATSFHGTNNSIRCGLCNFDDVEQPFQGCCLEKATESQINEGAPAYDPTMRFGAFCGDILWNVATASLQDVLVTLEESLYFGLGLFYGNSSTPTLAESGDGLSGADIGALLDGITPNSWTPTPEAMYAIGDSDTMANPGSAGILITDGIPFNGSVFRFEQTIQATCDVRAAGHTNYIVGLGGGTLTSFNNLQAAAAGTGCCGPSANADCSNGVGQDPCEMSTAERMDRDFWDTCYGSFAANNQTEFTNVLLDITGTINCTLPLDTSDWADGLPSDPRAVKVSLVMASEPLPQEVPHVSHPDADGEGWYFANTERTLVALTEPYCSQAANDEEVSEVLTDVACSCEHQFAGNQCLISQVVSTACPVGTKACNPDQTWYCAGPAEPMHEDCPFFTCPEWEEPQICHTHNEWRYQHHPNDPQFIEEGDYDADEEPNRCRVGVLSCENADIQCIPFQPMPEICDGRDTDCDGVVSNIEASWQKPQFDGFASLDSFTVEDDFDVEGAACFEQDMCRCMSGPAPHFGGRALMNATGPVSEAEEYEALLEEYHEYINSGDDGLCSCVDSLSY